MSYFELKQDGIYDIMVAMKKPIVEIGSIEEQIEKINESGQKSRLLLHACCGPCATSVLEYLTPYFDITVFYYNPNILPKEEFMRRLEAHKVVVSHFDGVKLVVPDQSETEYLPLVKGLEQEPEGGARCGVCFALRLDKTARYLLEHKDEFDFFCHHSHRLAAQRQRAHKRHRKKRCRQIWRELSIFQFHWKAGWN